MKSIFADTSYFAALVSRNDALHARALAVSEKLLGRVITTEYVLVEMGGLLSRREDRLALVNFVRDLKSDAATSVIPASNALFQAGLDLFADRLDKEWSLVDCISFVVMKQRRLKDALTADRHFEQAGFRAILRREK